MQRIVAKTVTLLSATVALSGLAAIATQAEVAPNPLFSDGAVLQRDLKVPVWGTASDGEKVTVTFQNQKVSTTAQNGQWKVLLNPLKAGGPYSLTIAGTNTIELKNVLVGDVWICSGQSNMGWPLKLSVNGDSDIASSKDPQLHLFSVPLTTSETPLKTVNSQWKESSPETTPDFTAVGYYFGRELRRALNVPIGLINTSWGGTYAEAWTSTQMLDSVPMLRPIVDNYAKARADYQRALVAYPGEVEKAKAAGKEPPKPPADPGDVHNPNRPSVLYNAMISPLLPYGIKGAIWYQGESNAGGAYTYQTLLPAMIRNWRQDWGVGDFPFLIVQLAPWMKIETEPNESAWAELREAQRLTSINVPNTGMAVITDLGDEKDIHPRQKGPVGARLALAARNVAYHQHLVSSGPTFDTAKVVGNHIVLTFKNTGSGLMAKDGELKGFTITGADKKWVNATAEIKGRTVVVSSPQVAQPVAVRFGWANYPVVNLYNKEGLPASPFRTDDFPLTTQPH